MSDGYARGRPMDQAHVGSQLREAHGRLCGQLRAIRYGKGLSANGMAGVSLLDKETLLRIERGEDCKLSSLLLYLQALGITLEWVVADGHLMALLLGGTGRDRPVEVTG